MSAVIDLHSHVIAADTRRYPLAPMGGHQSGWARERPVDFEGMIAAMDEAGVAKSALVQASTSYTHDNSYVADAVAAHPERFTGVFSVDVCAADANESIGYWMSRGLTGLRVFIAGHTAAAKDARLDDPRSFPAWETAEKAGIPVCVQLRAEGLPQLVTVLERFPRVRVVLDHMARPIVEDGPPYAAAARPALAALPQRDRDWIFFRTAESLYPALAGLEKSRAAPAASPETESIIPKSGSSNPRKKEHR